MRIVLKPMGALLILVVPILIVILGFTMMRPGGKPNTVAEIGGPASGPGAAPAPPAVHLDSRSPVRNASFEAIEGKQKPTEWNVDLAGNNALNVAYVEDLHGAHTGKYHLTHYGGSDYDVRTTQHLTGLTNGKYTLRAWTRSNGGKNESYLVAKDFGNGETRKDAMIPTGEENWVQVQVADIPVTNGQCVIGIYSKAKGGRWTLVDDVEFIPQK